MTLRLDRHANDPAQAEAIHLAMRRLSNYTPSAPVMTREDAETIVEWHCLELSGKGLDRLADAVAEAK